ncbi:MAG: YbhB/YbcL family Raf kinase inhibitor-like protein [Acidobacteriota bacterium]
MRRLCVALALIVASPWPAAATWSVIAVDTATRQVAIASATCVDRDDQFLMGVQAVIVPGKGVAACQAAVDGTHRNQMLVFAELQKGTAPSRILEMLAADPAFQSRQFGILDLQGRSAVHSGLGNGYVSQALAGQVPGTTIHYAIQGNILRPGRVVPNAAAAFVSARGTITDRVMAAMEAADGSGGDGRCECPPWPTDGTRPQIACDGRTAHVAYILMADATDTSGDSHNNGQYALYITVSQPGPEKGPNQIRAGENLNPVKTLRLRYDAWKRNPQAFTMAAVNPPRVAPPPATPPPPPPGRRPPVAVMTLASPAFADGAAIPRAHSQFGAERSPALTWDGVPEGTGSFVLVVRDVDSVVGAGLDPVLHWLVWNIPAAARGLPEGVPHGATLPDLARQISQTGPSYRGPGAPAGGPPHHYVFELYAIEGTLNVPAVGASPADTLRAVMDAMAGRVRGKATLTGTFRLEP